MEQDGATRTVDKPIDIERALSAPSRAEIFTTLSALYRIIALQNMALMSLRDPKIDDFDSELERANSELRKVLPEIEHFVRSKPDGD